MRTIVILLLTIFCGSSTFAQSGKFWSELERSAVPQEVEAERTLFATQYRALKFDYKAFKQFLAQAPMEVEGKKHVAGQTVAVPYPDGRTIDFLMVESPNMMAGISARYPNIKSYYGYNVAEPYRKVRMVISPLGIHMNCSGPEGQVYLDPYSNGEKEYVQSYFVTDYIPTAEQQNQVLGCGTTQEMIDDYFDNREDISSADQPALKTADIVIEKRYRIAIAATGEWTERYHQGSVENGLAAMNVSVARINSIFERDLAARCILIDREDEIIHPKPGLDPYFMANNGGALLGQNTEAINNIINVGDYDFGHVYTAGCTDVGGVANLGVICGLSKANGVTCHGSANIDAITAGTVCHEIGHQFGANHTFNNCGSTAVNQNQNSGTAYEPGSGSTILSYNGCGGQGNAIPGGRLDFYHASSLRDMYNNIETAEAGSCPQKIESDNNKPVVNFPYEDGFYVPISTPMKIEAEATDENGDELFYSFEQFDLGPISVLGSPQGDAPIFRVWYPHTENFRYLPRLNTVIANQTDITEVLPTYSRNLTFRVVVRDYNSTIGTAVWDEVAFKATDEAGPFLVMSPNTTLDLVGGSSFNVEWDVANTDGALVNCQSVNILLSTDGGNNFDVMLAENVPNDGMHDVVIPDIISNLARVKIEAADNIFYDMSNGNSRIIAPTTPAFNFTAGPYFKQYCIPTDNFGTVELSTLSILDYDSPLTFQVLGLPDGGVATINNTSVVPGQNANIEFDLSAVEESGLFDIEILGISAAGDTVSQSLQFDVYYNDFSDLTLTAPLLNAVGIEEVPDFSWSPSSNADSYTIEIASSPSFAPETILATETDLIDPNYQPSVLLGKNIPVYWRIAPNNICGQGPWSSVNVFHTETLTCDIVEDNATNLIIPISANTVEHKITFFDDGTINDFNIANLNIAYSPVTYLKLTLIGPEGDEVLLMEDICGGTSIVNIGFDNESPTEIPCPASDGLRHKPFGDLSVFNGKNVKGDWTLRITTAGSAFDPGRLRSIALEVCSNVSQTGPQLINNETLLVRTNGAQTIEPSHLLVEDANNNAGELIYTLVEGPYNGALSIDGETLEMGAQFSQIKINQLNFIYSHDGSDVGEDEFYFTVIDGEGGFIGKTKFNINIDPNNPVLGVENVALQSLAIFPNPANQSITIDFPEGIEQAGDIVITDIQGRQLKMENIGKGLNQLVMKTNDLTPGVYFVQWLTEAGMIANEKLIIQR